MVKSSILILDDEINYLELLKALLNQEGYLDIITQDDPEKALGILDHLDIDLIILDVYMPKMNGLEFLEKVSEKYPQIPVIMVTAVDEIEIALRAIKLGAYEYITKPPDTDRLFLTIKRALEQRFLELQLDSHRSVLTRPSAQRKNFADIITESPEMQRVFDLVEIFAPTNEIVLITGETGTGKDMIAKKIHDLSPRRNNSFVVVNLASISPSLFESELFGHEKGAFTGATTEKIGYFESANGGTIFLDEIGELPKELQGKLLRAIQYNEIYRIGSSRPIKLDIRIIAATNRNLVNAIDNSDFRADLYYRLTRGLIQLPPLRERGSDAILLANHFLKFGNLTYKKNVTGFSQAAFDTINAYPFPGNVRELENVIMNSVATAPINGLIENIKVENIPPKTKKAKSTIQLATLETAIENHINSVMNFTNNNVQKAAFILGISERTLQRRLKNMRESDKDSEK